LKFTKRFDANAHLTEASALVTQANREKLYREWARYWDVSKPVLLEKSPPNTIKTRFLQEIFSSERSYFVILTRHPLASSYYEWKHEGLWDCGRRYIQHWLHIHDILRTDQRRLKHKIAFMMEDFAENAEINLDSIFHAIGVDSKTLTELVHDHNTAPPSHRQRRSNDDTPDEATELHTRKARDLEASSGSLHVQFELLSAWYQPFLSATASAQSECSAVIQDFEARLNEYGYSMKQPNAYSKSRFVSEVNGS
jgi:hypothetical protein